MLTGALNLLQVDTVKIDLLLNGALIFVCIN